MKSLINSCSLASPFILEEYKLLYMCPFFEKQKRKKVKDVGLQTHLLLGKLTKLLNSCHLCILLIYFKHSKIKENIKYFRV